MQYFILHKYHLHIITKKKLPSTVKNLKEFGIAIQDVKSSIETEDVEKTIANFDSFIDSKNMVNK